MNFFTRDKKILITSGVVVILLAGGVFVWQQGWIAPKTVQILDETANWETYTAEEFSFKYPSNWSQETIIPIGSGAIQEFKNKDFTLTFEFRGNYSQADGKPYEDLTYDFLKFKYVLPTKYLDGQEAIQVLPRAGSENKNQVYLFSKDKKSILRLELDTLSEEDAKIVEGQRIFDQILSTFKFLEADASVIVLTPNGGEKWRIGETYEINWKASLYPANSDVLITLLGKAEDTIVKTTNTGSYRWTVPQALQGTSPSGSSYTIPLGGDTYKIAIYIDGGGAGKANVSDNYFSIVSPNP